MQFNDFCRAYPKKAAKLKEKLGKKTFHKYASGDVSRPDPETIDIIVADTGYLVTANDFYGIDPLKAAKATMSPLPA